MADTYEFYNLGIGDPVPISAASRLGIGDLLDEVVKHFPEQTGEIEEDDRPRIAIVGKPNVGKSSIINKLIGENRVIVSNIAGTTRDAIDTEVRRIIEEAYAKARGIIERKSEQINRMADLLLEKETIYAEDIERILGPAAQVPREDDDPKKGVVVADDDAASGTAAAPPDAPTAGTGTTQEGDAGSASGTKTAASGAANAEKSELK